MAKYQYAIMTHKLTGAILYSYDGSWFLNIDGKSEKIVVKSIHTILNKMGSEGWELITATAITGDDGTHNFFNEKWYFKRQI